MSGRIVCQCLLIISEEIGVCVPSYGGTACDNSSSGGRVTQMVHPSPADAVPKVFPSMCSDEKRHPHHVLEQYTFRARF